MDDGAGSGEESEKEKKKSKLRCKEVSGNKSDVKQFFFHYDFDGNELSEHQWRCH